MVFFPQRNDFRGFVGTAMQRSQKGDEGAMSWRQGSESTR
jgi:hypothetical protein